MPATANQKTPSTGPVIMDSAKFLGAINSSVQAKLAFVEQRVAAMGKEAGANWQLVALKGDQLIIEDQAGCRYYQASCRTDQAGHMLIENVRPVRIVESRKKPFSAACLQLVEGIERNDQRAMAAAFGKMAAHRFSGCTVPPSGLVLTRDGVTRRIPVAATALDEDVRARLIAAIVEAVNDRVVVEGGVPVAGSFATARIKLPITEWTCRKVVARQMRAVAEDAYKSQGFQDRIYQVAALLTEGKVKEAVDALRPFLAEQQEFCMLNRRQVQALVENTLATRACFNPNLCRDTATLFWRTNLAVNRAALLKEWKATAQRAANVTLLENVEVLGKAKNFEASYDRFVRLVFNEDTSPRRTMVDAFVTTLEAIRRTPRIQSSTDLSGKIGELLERLKTAPDHAVIAEVEDLLAAVKGDVDQAGGQTLDNFNDMPGDSGDAFGGDDLAAAGGGTDLAGGDKPGTSVVFNINIGGDGGGVDVGGGDEGGADDLNLDAGPEKPPAAGAAPAGGAAAGGAGGDLDLGDLGEDIVADDARTISEDPYALTDTTVKMRSRLGADYGVPPISVTEDCDRVVAGIFHLIEQRQLDVAGINKALPTLAVEGIKLAGLRIPAGKQDAAIDQVVTAFAEEFRRRQRLDENQFKTPTRFHRYGQRKAAINKREGKKTATESAPAGVVWVESQEDAALGEFDGVRFILDHGGAANLDALVTNEDASIRVPVPQQLRESALAAAELADADPRPFLGWLAENIEQLRDSDAAERRTLDEAIARIVAGADGHIEVQVDGQDPNVSVVDPADAGPDGPPLGDGPLPGGPDDGMMPVDTMPDAADGPPVSGGDDMTPDTMPDFEDDDASADGPPKPPAGGGSPPKPPTGGSGPSKAKAGGESDDEDDEGVAEDHDVTDPSKGKYKATATENPRKQPKAKLPPAGDDSLEEIGSRDDVDKEKTGDTSAEFTKVGKK